MTIFAPKRRANIKESFSDYYSVSTDIKIEFLSSFDQNDLLLFMGPIRLWLANFFLRRNLKKVLSEQEFDLIYTRTSALLSALLKAETPVIIELHTLPRRNKSSFVRQCNQCKKIVCLTSLMRNELVSWGVKDSRVIVEGDAVDLAQFNKEFRSDVWRNAQGIPSDIPVIGYAGQLESMGLSKGVDVLLEALNILMEKGIDFHALIAGGPNSVRDKFRSSLSDALLSRAHFIGILPREDVSSMLSSCDVLVYPAPRSSHPFYQRDTSPMKVFEYMAAGKPIVCAELPPLRDVVNEDMVNFFIPGDSYNLADVIANVISNQEDVQEQVQKAKDYVSNHTWKKRMGRILSYL